MPEYQPNLAWDTLLQLDDSFGSGPLHIRMAKALRDAISTGRIPAGSALPPSRQLAIDLSCSRWVVTEVYEQLAAEGYLSGRIGSGTRVRNTHHHPSATDSELAPDQPRFDLAPGLPDLRAFPRASWSRAWREAVATMSYSDFAYPPRGGHPRLRRVLAGYLSRVRGAVVNAADVTITTGIEDGITRVSKALMGAGHERIAVENPCWRRLLRSVHGLGLDLVPVAVDSEGLRTTELASVGVRAVIVAPAHQFPTGTVLSPSRRAVLLDWVRDVDGMILEDDYDAEFRYDRRPVGTLQGIDPDHVALFGSLSKTLAPALNLGWTVTPSPLTDAIRSAETRMMGPSVLEQLTLARFIETGSYDRHLRAHRRKYRARRDRLVAALAARLPQIELSGIAAGLHILLRLPPELVGSDVVETARARGIRLMDLRSCMAEDPGPPGGGSVKAGRGSPIEGLVLGYGNLDDDVVDEAVFELAAVIRRLTILSGKQ